MTTETAAATAVRAAARAYDVGLIGASRRIRARAARRPVTWVPWALAGAAIAWVLLPKRARGPLLSAALPFVAASVRGLAR